MKILYRNNEFYLLYSIDDLDTANCYKNRKRRIMPVDYCETKRRKRVETVMHQHNENAIQIKIEQIQLFRTAIDHLNARIGVEVISDDEEDSNIFELDDLACSDNEVEPTDD